MAASAAKTDQKKQIDIPRRDTLQIFLLKHMPKETEVIIKFNESVFWPWNINIVKLWETNLGKHSSCAFYLVIAPRHILEHITVLKSDCQFYEWSSVTFQKKITNSVPQKKN